MSKNYYLHKDNKTGEIMYLEYDKIKGYPITPKTNIKDAIEVTKVILVNPGFREKVLKKKVQIKIRYLLQFLEEANDGGCDEGDIKRSIMDAEKLKYYIIHRYVKYFGNSYGGYSVHQIQLIINRLKVILYRMNMQRRIFNSMENQLYYLDEDDVKKGRGR